MKVSEIMSVGVQSVRPGTPLATARARMRAKKIHHLLVMEEAEILFRVFTNSIQMLRDRGYIIPPEFDSATFNKDAFMLKYAV